MAIFFRPRSPIRFLCDVSGILPGSGQSADALAARQIPYGSRLVELGELFQVKDAGGDTAEHRWEGDLGKVDYLGAELADGLIRIDGQCGNYLGESMRGGRIEIRGDAANGAGRSMSGGLLDIHGNAGDDCGGHRIGEARGMRGGVIRIRGHAGDFLGNRMRRGQLLVTGNAGNFVGHAMLAGTIVVGGSVGESVGLAMKRGTIICPSLPATAIESNHALSADGQYHVLNDSAVFRMLERMLQQAELPISFPAQFHVLDRGRGEILCA